MLLLHGNDQPNRNRLRRCNWSGDWSWISRIASARVAFATVCVASASIVLLLSGCGNSKPGEPPSVNSLWDLPDSDSVARGGPAEHAFTTTVHQPTGPPLVELTEPDPQGRVGLVACSTCHSAREPNFANRTASDLDEFHLNMAFQHGDLACAACHNPRDYDTLRLADETAVEYSEVMQLCSQCHGPQATAYQHGGHGGMTGYWDLDRGPRVRNNCIDCHDPHQPKFPRMVPTFKPRDRFLHPATRKDSHE